MQIKYLKKKKNNIVIFYSSYTGNCSQCRTAISTSIGPFFVNTNFIFIESYHEIFINELPKEITINEKRFRLLCATVYKSTIRHFVGLYLINDDFYIVDDLGQTTTLLEPLSNDYKSKRKRNQPQDYYNIATTTSLYYSL